MASQSQASRYRWIVLLLIFLSYMIAGADRANIGVVVPFMKKEFELSNTDIGAMASLFYLGYAFIQVPVGLLYEKFGVRRIFTFAMVATSLSTMFLGFAHSALQLKIGRVLLGLAEGPINVGILTVINRWFPPHEKATAVGVFMSSIKFAPAVVPPLCAFIIYTFGWREVFYIFALPGLFIAAIWFFCVSDDPRRSRFANAQEVAYIESTAVTDGSAPTDGVKTRAGWPILDRLIMAREIQPLADNVAILRSWNVWGCALGYGFIVGVAYAIMTWVPTYLINVKHYPLFQMGFVAATPWVGAIIGNLIGGVLSDRLFDKRRKPVMILTAASTVLMMYALIYSPGDPFLLAGLFIATGILLNLGYSTFLVYPMGLVAKDKVPLASAIVNTVGSLGGAFAPFVVGMILDRYSWDMVFLFLAASSLATLALVLTIIEPIALFRQAPSAPVTEVPRTEPIA
ncbi:MFS transporter [Rhodopseudomonas sp. BR0M22]|uniref:MFS transporter n=1 Tax=Rhodopseudomonas sp. BR0M22 TaxID=2269369 RepID=UPI0013E019C2|nr:MFS transporter [Rhodopseudomonas sp. BR0M22]NEW90736.1 MFS transporter [Rhodopseudomonas sp. BR0M22]